MTLWTPDGEHPVGRGEPAPEPAAKHDPLAGLSEEDRQKAEAMAQEMAAVREQLASVPASVIVSNHAMGLYELAAIHLSASPPKFVDAQLAIDAMSAIVEQLQGRLGENESALKDALGQLRLAYVQLHNQAAS